GARGCRLRQGRPGRGPEGVSQRAGGRRRGLPPRAQDRGPDGRHGGAGSRAGGVHDREVHGIRSGQVGLMRYLQTLTLAGTLAALLAVAACSKDKSIDQPAKLTPLTPKLRVQRIWSAGVDDKKAAVLRLGLGLSVADNRVYAAGHRGDLVAFDLASGRVLWRAHTRAPLAGGTAADRKSTRLNSSHRTISYAVFCL